MEKAVFWINDGAGLGVEVDTGMTLATLLEEKQVELSGNQIKVNRRRVGADYVIKPDDIITVMPVKMEGA